MVAPAAGERPVSITCSRHFLEWLRQERLSLALTTYQTHRLILLGCKPDGTLSGFERKFEHAMGLCATRERLWLATRFQLWEFHNSLADQPADAQGFDALYVPRIGHVTGDLDMHDIALDAAGAPLFVNTLYSCLARPSATHSFEPVWKPKFISQLLPEDRCHLNGLAMRDGRPAFTTAISRSDVAAGWRERRGDGGVVVDVNSKEIAASGLSMPHSPRWRENRLWLLNSGSGELGTIDLNRGVFEPVAFVPGYGRGLAFHKQWAVAGLSKPRHNKVFNGLALDARLQEKDAVAKCGVRVIDLTTGGTAHWVDIEGVVTELYDVQILPDVSRPKALGFKTDEIQHRISFIEHGKTTTHQLVAKTRDAAPAKPQRAPVAGIEFKVQTAVRTETLRQGFGELIFSPSRLSGLPPEVALASVLAFQGSAPVGLAILMPETTGSAQLLSLLVLPGQRRKGIANQLLELAEERAARMGLGSLSVRLRSHWAMNEAMTALLEKRGWLPPLVQSLRCRSTLEKLSAAPWLKNSPRLAPELELVNWTALTAAERAQIERVWATKNEASREHRPWPMPDRLDPSTSVAVRRGSHVAGWMVTHRIKPETLQYSAWYVDPELRRSNAAAVLLIESIRRQINSGIPNLHWEFSADNRPMMNLMRRHLKPWLSGYSEVRTSGKVLAPVGAR